VIGGEGIGILGALEGGNGEETVLHCAGVHGRGIGSVYRSLAAAVQGHGAIIKD